MKDVSQIKACVVDYGYFIELASRLAIDLDTVFYHAPTDSEFQEVKTSVQGDGIEGVERIREFLTPEIISETDLFIFPDIGYAGVQRYLRSIGKAVWGSFRATEYEIYRTKFIDLLKEVNLPVVKSQKIIGLSNLKKHLADCENKWIKVDRFRGNMETWKHIDFERSENKLDELAIEFGAVKEHIVFVVQDNLKSDVEAGYDGWTIDGQFPQKCFHGFEEKNELYLASQVEYENLPQQILEVNEALIPVFKETGYRNWCASEIRIKDGVPYFIDPTFRIPGMSGEHQLETCSNISEVIWAGANGIIVEPEFTHLFAAAATLHHSDGDGWLTMGVPKEIRKWIKLNHFFQLDGLYHFAPRCNDEVGLVIGVGDSIKEAIGHLKDNFEALDGEQVSIEFDNFKDLLEEATEATDQGIEFTDQPIPSPAEVLS